MGIAERCVLCGKKCGKNARTSGAKAHSFVIPAAVRGRERGDGRGRMCAYWELPPQESRVDEALIEREVAKLTSPVETERRKRKWAEFKADLAEKRAFFAREFAAAPPAPAPAPPRAVYGLKGPVPLQLVRVDDPDPADPAAAPPPTNKTKKKKRKRG